MQVNPDLYHDHLRLRLDHMQHWLATLGYDAVVIDSGEELTYERDDEHIPFRADARFKFFCPVNAPYATIFIEAGHHLPHLIWHRPSDFWHDYLLQPPDQMAQLFEITFCDQASSRFAVAQKQASRPNLRTAYLGPAGLHTALFDASNPDALCSALDYARCQKSEFELEAMRNANARAAAGHRAVAQIIASGRPVSEFELYLRYLKAVEHVESELPYRPIIAFDHHAATLHYRNKAREPRTPSLCLIDAGARCWEYASDITRTTAAPTCPDIVRDLIRAVDRMCLDIAANLRVGVAMSELQQQYQLETCRLMLELGVLRGISLAEASERGAGRIFAPHGIGHGLGLYTHDVGANMIAPNGQRPSLRPNQPHGRLHRPLRLHEVVTIEPGIYFGEALWNLAVESGLTPWLDSRAYQALVPYGGVRIEDNLVVGEETSENMTRTALGKMPARA